MFVSLDAPWSLIHSTTIFVIRLHLEVFAWPDSPYVLVSLVLACPFSAVFWQSKPPISPPAPLMVILQHLSLTIPNFFVNLKITPRVV